MGAGPQNYPYQELEFAKDGSPVHPEQADAVRRLADQVTDVVVVSHGWNNDMDEARVLYRNLFASVDAVRQARATRWGDRSIGVVGILWPSKRFADAELVPGGAAGIGDADPTLPGDLRAMAGAFDSPGARKVLDRAAALAGRLEGSPKAQREYADLLRSLVSVDESEPADAPDELFALDGPDLMDRLHTAMLTLSLGAALPAGGGAMGLGGAIGGGGGGPAAGAGGGAAGVGSALTHAWSTGRSLLNFITYYEMKARAGRIGSQSVAPVLHTQVAGRATVHLVGHSFGARLVTAAADGLPGARSVGSLSLLQAAFSHNSFAKEWEQGKPGGFRRMVDERRVSGSTIITHTRNDKAVGIAYAIASSIADQAASGLGDADSPFGGLGSNGAQRTSEADDQALQDVGATYQFASAGIHNLLADRFVSGHGDVSNTQVANAVLQNVLGAPRS